MTLISIASNCGVTTNSLENLINKEVSVSVASRLGTTRASLQDFINGGSSITLAGKLGITTASLQELRNQIGKDGAVGLIIGLLYNQNS